MKKKPRYALSVTERYSKCLIKHLTKERVKLEIVDVKKCRRGKDIIKTCTCKVRNLVQSFLVAKAKRET